MLFGADMQFSTASFLYFGISNFDRMSKRAISEVLLMTLMMTFCEGRIPGLPSVWRARAAPTLKRWGPSDRRLCWDRHSSNQALCTPDKPLPSQPHNVGSASNSSRSAMCIYMHYTCLHECAFNV